MADPFKIDGPTCISFSGGRTSAYMLWRVLQANGGFFPNAGELCVVFANTGREVPQTLAFVERVSQRWHVPIHWVEFTPDGEGFREVWPDTASRKGEPFEQLIFRKKFLPNPVARFCTTDLKIKPTELFLKSRGWTEWDNMLGFRADEPTRVAKIRAQPVVPESPDVERVVPLARAGITKAHVRDFWSEQDFDLELPIAYDGTTLGGNCDGCFLIPPYQRLSRMRKNPSMPVWWIAQEDLTGARFTKDGHSYREMARYARDQVEMFDPNEEAISCFCGD
jgi:3'-phosphoadenosine 5'-phosphosulfate sulfotransferase (PAPS reductase)/FAD synthetase